MPIKSCPSTKEQQWTCDTDYTTFSRNSNFKKDIGNRVLRDFIPRQILEQSPTQDKANLKQKKNWTKFDSNSTVEVATEKNRMYLRNGRLPLIVSSKAKVYLSNVQVDGPVIFMNKKVEYNKVLLFQGSSVSDIRNTNGRIVSWNEYSRG